jgi:uncharacterized protein YkwD
MPGTGSSRARRIVAIAATAGLLLALAAPEAASARSRERKLFRITNRTRVRNGVHRVKFSPYLSRIADRHSERMASRGKLFHTHCLPCKIEGRDWDVLGENAAAAGSVRGAHRRLMRSSGHRANILSRRYHRMGFGVARGRGFLWITEIFYG